MKTFKNIFDFQAHFNTEEKCREYLEAQFKEGMSWENHGFTGWHIDHIIPLASATTEHELIKLFHYTNLQPLWANENWKKKDKILPLVS